MFNKCRTKESKGFEKIKQHRKHFWDFSLRYNISNFWIMDNLETIEITLKDNRHLSSYILKLKKG